MKPYTKSKNAKKFRVGKFYIIVTIAFIFAAIGSLYTDSIQMRRLINERAEIQSLISEEEQKQITLNSQKHYFESDSFIEKTAREKLGLVKPGDVIFINRNAK